MSSTSAQEDRRLTIEIPVELPDHAECAACAVRLKEDIEQTKGVSAVDMSARSETMTVHFDPDLVTIRGLEERTREACGLLAARYCHRTLVLGGLDCADCARSIERALARRPGVLYTSVNFASSTLFVEMDCAAMPLDVVVADVKALGYQVWTEEEYRARLKGQTQRPFYLRSLRARLTLGSFVFLLTGAALWLITSPPHNAAVVLLSVAIVVGGYPVARNAWNALIRTRNVDMNVLMTVATVGAAAVGSWVEAALVVALFGLGETLEGWAMDRTRGSIQRLMDLSPDEATVRHQDREETIPVDQVLIGETVLVKPGARIPLDGVVVKGRSSVDESPITGESLPREKQENDLVYAGTINQRGSLEVRVESLARDSTLARLIEMVEEAQGQKAPTQRWVDSFARYYTPAVMAMALLTAVLPPLVLAASWGEWVYKALALLILACPCALVLSTPVSIVSAIGAAGRQGVLIKGGAHLEAAGTVTAVAFDKTGTLTEGTPRVTAILSFNGDTEDAVLTFAAAVERDSEHPLAGAVLHAATARGIDLLQAYDFESMPGRGARATVGGSTCYVGNSRLFEELGVALDRPASAAIDAYQNRGETVVLVGTAAEVIGAISVADQVRPLSRSAIAGLRTAGVRYITMLTGDNRQTAAAVAADLGLDDYQAELLPEHKVQAVRDIAAQHGPVAMIGDGVNDAPALAAATVGIAMGAAGTDIALETADIALMADDLTKVPFAIELSRATRATVRQNITFALALKVVTLFLVFPGWLTLWMAVLADTGGSLIVIGNGLRLVRHGRREVADSAATAAASGTAESTGLPARSRARTLPGTAVAAGCSREGCGCNLSGRAEPGEHDHEHDRGPVAAGNRASA